ncbi:MAG: helix-turn-helix domain-containing protein [Pseudonocardiaceae bacterium]
MVQRQLLTSSEVADALGLSRQTIARYVREGWIVPTLTTPGGQYRFDLDKVREELRKIAEDRRKDQGS